MIKSKLTSLKDVSASMLPAQVLILLSKYAKAVRQHTEMTVKISSTNVFLHIDNTNKLTDHPEIRRVYHELLFIVNRHLSEGSMRTNQQTYPISIPSMTEYLESELRAS